MSQDLKEFLFAEISEHLQKLEDIYTSDSGYNNADEFEYHHGKCVELLNKIKGAA